MKAQRRRLQLMGMGHLHVEAMQSALRAARNQAERYIDSVADHARAWRSARRIRAAIREAEEELAAAEKAIREATPWSRRHHD